VVVAGRIAHVPTPIPSGSSYKMGLSNLLVQVVLGLTVQHKHQGGAGTAEHVGAGTLEEGSGSLVLHDLREAVDGAIVDAALDRLIGLHLQAATDGIEGVCHETGHDDGELSAGPLGGNANEGHLLVEGVETLEGVVQAELDTAVGDDTGDGDAETVVQGKDALGTLGGLHEAVTETVERTLAGTDIGGEASTGVVQGVNEAQGASTGQTARRQVAAEELPELGLRVVLGEHSLDGVLEGKVARLGGEVTDAVGEVSAPEGTHALLGPDASEAVENAGVAGDFAGNNLGVSILGLDDKLHALDGSGDGFGDRTGDAAGGEVNKDIRLLSHFCSNKY